MHWLNCGGLICKGGRRILPAYPSTRGLTQALVFSVFLCHVWYDLPNETQPPQMALYKPRTKEHNCMSKKYPQVYTKEVYFFDMQLCSLVREVEYKPRTPHQSKDLAGQASSLNPPNNVLSLYHILSQNVLSNNADKPQNSWPSLQGNGGA